MTFSFRWVLRRGACSSAAGAPWRDLANRARAAGVSCARTPASASWKKSCRSPADCCAGREFDVSDATAIRAMHSVQTTTGMPNGGESGTGSELTSMPPRAWTSAK